MKRYSKDVIKGLEHLGFDHVWTNTQGFLCYVYPDDPAQTELSISPSISSEQPAKAILRRAQRIVGVKPQVEKRKGNQVKERAEADRERARERLRIVRDKQAQLLAQRQADAAEVERVRLLVERRERELAAIERLMTQPPAGGSAHRGVGRVRHCSGNSG